MGITVTSMKPAGLASVLMVWGATALGAFGFEGNSEHPRLLMSKNDVAAIRARAGQEPYASVARALRESLIPPDTQAGETNLYDDYGVKCASLYVLTGDKAFAEAAGTQALLMVGDQRNWNNGRSKGLTRAAGVLRVALSYDFCADAWPEVTRTQVSSRLRFAADGLMRSMGAGANVMLANNWQAVRYAGAGLAYLASDESDGTNKAGQAYSRLKAHLNANLGDNGWNPEGIDYTQYPWQFTGPFGIAAQRAGLGDLRQEVPKTALTLWTTIVGTVAIPRDKGVGLHADLCDDNPVWNSDGTASLAYWYAPEVQKPALKFMFDRLCGAGGDKSWDSGEAGGIYAVLYYPTRVQARDPAQVMGLNYTDRSQGIALFRNRFKDEDDIVALVNAHSRQPTGCHGGPDTDTFRIIGLGSCWAVGSGRSSDPSGQSNLFAGPPGPPRRGGGGLGKLEGVEFVADGGGWAVTSGSCLGVQHQRRVFGVDFSTRSGAEAVFVSVETSDNGAVWRMNTPEFNRVTWSNNIFTLAAPNGAMLTGTVLEPATPAFRTGTFARGGTAGFPYRGKVYANNTWLEFDCTRSVRVVMTLQVRDTRAPVVSAGDGVIHVGGLPVRVASDRIVFGP